MEINKKAYEKFVTVKKTLKRGIQVSDKEDVLRETRKYFGYVSLITNEKMDVSTALHLYRIMDVVKKVVGSIRERLNMCRLLVSSECGMEEKILAEFVSLILISYLDYQMKKVNFMENTRRTKYLTSWM